MDHGGRGIRSPGRLPGVDYIMSETISHSHWRKPMFQATATRVAALATILMAAGFALSGDGDDLKRMSGTWSGEIIEAGGKPATEEFKSAQVKLIIKGNEYSIYFGDKQIASGAIKLDQTKKPRHIDAIQKEGPYKDKIQPGIYEFKGEEFRVVFTQPDQERPKEFKTREGTKEALILYKRLKEA